MRALLRAANDEFAEHGFAGAQIVRIAERSKVSVGSLYRFFPDKKSFALALTEEYRDAVRGGFAAILEPLKSMADIPETVHGLVAAADALQKEHGGYYRLSGEVPAHDPDWPGHIVRSSLVSEFAAKLDSIGVVAVPGAAPVEDIIDFAIETSRSTLAGISGEPAQRAVIVAELDSMLTAYLMSRLTQRAD